MAQVGVLPAAEWNRYRRCFFCYHPREGEVLATRSFSVVLDDSPLVEGHLLIHPREHWGCAGELPPDQMAELVDVREQVRELLLRSYGVASFYEHGRAGHCSSNGDCNHFHLHALPIDVSIETPLAARFRRFDPKTYDSMPDLFERMGDYLYFEDHAGRMSYFPASVEIESHLLRTLIANAIGQPERANWESMRDPALVASAYRRFESLHGKRSRQLPG
jgi:diadenosine tetraphosphate (Ap4A) HIT family hydrolase